MTKLGRRLIQAATEALEIARGDRPARVWVFCEQCNTRILISYLPAPNERWLCAECWSEKSEP